MKKNTRKQKCTAYIIHTKFSILTIYFRSNSTLSVFPTKKDDKRNPIADPTTELYIPIIVVITLYFLGNQLADNLAGLMYTNGKAAATIVYPTITNIH